MLPKSVLHNVFIYYIWSFKLQFVFKILLYQIVSNQNFVLLIEMLYILFVIK